MIVYVAGPMSGLPDSNLPAFAAATEQLTEAGYVARNPGRRGADHPEWAWADYIRRALPDLCHCDAVALLDGWEASRGAQLEVYVAKKLGMLVMPLEAWLTTLAATTTLTEETTS